MRPEGIMWVIAYMGVGIYEVQKACGKVQRFGRKVFA